MNKTSFIVALSLILLAACGDNEKNAAAGKEPLSPARPLPADSGAAVTANKPAGWENAAKEAPVSASKADGATASAPVRSALPKAAAAEKERKSGDTASLASSLASNLANAKKKARESVDADAVIKMIKEATNSVALIQLLTPLSQTTTRGPVVRGVFRDLLKNPDPAVREQTLMALEDYEGVAFMLDDMVPLLDDEDEDVRDSAMTTIADYVENRAKYEVLIKALDSKYPDVVEEAIFNLGFYTDVDFPTAQEWKDWWAKSKDTFKAE